MAWLGRDNDAIANALTAVAVGAAFQAAGEALAKGIGAGVSAANTRLKTAFRAMPDGERVVLDGFTPDPSARVRVAQDLDAALHQLEEGVPASELVPPAARLGDNASVAPNSGASIEPVVRDTVPMTEVELAAAMKKTDPEAVREFGKAVKQQRQIETETANLIEAVNNDVGRRLEAIDQQIATTEAKLSTMAKGTKSKLLNELEALHVQRETLGDVQKQMLADIAKRQMPKQAKAAAKTAKWEPLVERARARAQGEWETRSQALAAGRAGAGRVLPQPLPAQNAPAVKPASPRPIGEPIERPLPLTSTPDTGDSGAGSVIERVQRVADAEANAVVEANKAWVADVRSKLKDLEQAAKAKDGKIKPEDIVLADGTPVVRLLGIKNAQGVDVSDGQALGRAYDLERELDELDELGEAESVTATCRTRS